MAQRNFIFSEDFTHFLPRQGFRRASFPFCSPALSLIPPIQPPPDQWQGIYGSVLYPPKSADEIEEEIMERRTGSVSQDALAAVSSTNFESVEDIVIKRKFYTFSEIRYQAAYKIVQQ